MMILLPKSCTYRALDEATQGFTLFPQWPSEAGEFCPLMFLLSSATPWGLRVFLLLLVSCLSLLHCMTINQMILPQIKSPYLPHPLTVTLIRKQLF